VLVGAQLEHRGRARDAGQRQDAPGGGHRHQGRRRPRRAGADARRAAGTRGAPGARAGLPRRCDADPDRRPFRVEGAAASRRRPPSSRPGHVLQLRPEFRALELSAQAADCRRRPTPGGGRRRSPRSATRASSTTTTSARSLLVGGRRCSSTG
jgi:hypothetical protein